MLLYSLCGFDTSDTNSYVIAILEGASDGENKKKTTKWRLKTNWVNQTKQHRADEVQQSLRQS